MRVVVIDPRRDRDRRHRRPSPRGRADGDCALFNGLLAHLASDGPLDRAYIERHTTGFEAALAAARASDLAATAAADRAFARRSARLLRSVRRDGADVTVYSQGVNQSSSGTDKVNAIINCHLATGRIGRPGMGPFSITGQPNAMGGREVGGLANMLAAHMDIENPEHRARVQDFLALAAHSRKARPQGGRPVPRRGGRPGQGDLDHGAPTRSTACRTPTGCATASEGLPFRRRLRRYREHRHDALRPCRCCPRRPGARRTGRSPTPSGGSRASGRSSEAPAKRATTGRSSPKSPAAWASATPSLLIAGRDFRRTCSASRPGERRRARLRHRRLRPFRRDDYDALSPFQWPRVSAVRPSRRASSPRGLLHPRPQGRFVPVSAKPETRVTETSRSSSIPAGCATTGTR